MLRTAACTTALLGLLLAAPAAYAADDYLKPFPAFHIVANVYYVGTEGQANYLITTPAGNILINPGTDLRQRMDRNIATR